MSTYSTAALWTTTTHFSVVISMLLRNIIFARFLNPNDFAIALTFGLVLSLFEYVSNFGHENLMQRSKNGGRYNFQATMQCMMVFRGLVVALLVVSLSPYIPIFLKLEEIEFNYALLAIVPLINGFAHLDHHRLHRRQIYSLTAKISLSADFFSILVALISVLIWDSYWAFYISFVFRHTFSTILSHAWARRAYTLRLSKSYVSELLTFGLPLLAVGVLKYIGTEVDKAIVANIAGLDVFAIYILTLMLVVNGANVVTLSLSKIMIRRVSVAGRSISEVVESNGVVLFYLVAPVLLTLCVLGEDLIGLIFGRKYITVPFLVLTVSFLVGARSLNQWLNQAVIASAPTQLMLIADISRFVVATLGLSVIYHEASVLHISLTFVLAELAYFSTLVTFLHRTHSILLVSARALLCYVAWCLIMFAVYSATYQGQLGLKFLFLISCLGIFFALFLSLSSICRRQTRALLMSIRGFVDNRQ